MTSTSINALPSHSSHDKDSRGPSQAASDDQPGVGMMSFDTEREEQGGSSFVPTHEMTNRSTYDDVPLVNHKSLDDNDEAMLKDGDEIDDEIGGVAGGRSTATFLDIWHVMKERWKNVGLWLENTIEAQVAMLGLIYFDLVISCLLVAITSTSEATEGGWFSSLFWMLSDFVRSTIMLRLLHTVLSLTMTISVLELLALMTTFGVQEFFSHVGYTIDAFVVAIIFYYEVLIALVMEEDYAIEEMTHVLGGGNLSIHLLSVLRMWRVARLTTTFIKVATKEQTNRIHELESVEENTQTLKSTLTKLLEHSKKEHEEKLQLQNDVQNLEDEVETLSEALRIAARDVSLGKVAMKQMSSDQYELDDNENRDQVTDSFAQGSKAS